MVLCAGCHLHSAATALSLAVGGLFQSASHGVTAGCAGCPCSSVSADVHGCAWMCMDVHPVHAVRSMKAQRKHQEGLAQVRAGWSLGVLSMALKPLSVLQS